MSRENPCFDNILLYRSMKPRSLYFVLVLFLISSCSYIKLRTGQEHLLVYPDENQAVLFAFSKNDSSDVEQYTRLKKSGNEVFFVLIGDSVSKLDSLPVQPSKVNRKRSKLIYIFKNPNVGNFDFAEVTIKDKIVKKIRIHMAYM